MCSAAMLLRDSIAKLYPHRKPSLTSFWPDPWLMANAMAWCCSSFFFATESGREIFGTNNSNNNNNNNAFLWQQKDLFYWDVGIKDERVRKRERAGWRMMGFSLELTSKLLALMMIRPAMEMGSLELVGNVISCIFYIVADQDLVLDKQGIEGSQILATWEILKVKAGGCIKECISE